MCGEKTDVPEKEKSAEKENQAVTDQISIRKYAELEND